MRQWSWQCLIGVSSALLGAACTKPEGAPYARTVPVRAVDTAAIPIRRVALDPQQASRMMASHTWPLPAANLGSVSDLIMSHGLLLVVQPGRTHQLFGVDTATGTVGYRAMPRTDATPQMFTSITRDLQNGDLLWLHEFHSNHLMAVRVVPTQPEGRVVAQRSLRFTGALRTPSVLPDGHVLSSGLVSRGLAVEFDRDGSAREVAGAPAGEDSIPEEVRVHLHLGRLGVRPDGARYATGYLSTPYLDVMARPGGLVQRLILQADTTQPPAIPTGVRTKAGQWRFALQAGMRSGTLDVAATPRYIYVLFGGRVYQASQPDSVADSAAFALADWVAQITWEGDVVQLWRLQTSANAITVTDDDRTLIASTPRRAILSVYRLPTHRTASRAADR